MSVELSKKTCDTIGCLVPATHVLTWHDRDTGDEYTENVCETDGMRYNDRPALRATLAPMAPTPASQSGYTPATGDYVFVTRVYAGTTAGRVTGLRHGGKVAVRLNSGRYETVLVSQVSEHPQNRWGK